MGQWDEQFNRTVLENLTKSINGLSAQLKSMADMSNTMDKTGEKRRLMHKASDESSIDASESAMNNLRKEIRAFGQQAITLCDAISAADADELVASGYPFDASFDEMMIKIIEWSSTVVKESYKQEKNIEQSKIHGLRTGQKVSEQV